ncbi:hypothetical protein TH53_15300 [Pedobacter lusitanus]|uniref:RagB/SusD family nutrient uptake outer membrane protein n=1 Tax=Pedobacter lusitanus TaxID=1503925 RepID=A0A0D0GPC4_9SPHI|nr:RagB/SusD family nutrient uptake outer membrane protein [Pedobacter lusitanus]KIO76321.1 hypothetical protein TH53_15300 [Pedobacter lusitanus]
MRKNLHYIICAWILLILIQSCKLTEVTDLKPEFKLDEGTVVTDVASADKLLAGTYYSLRDEAMANQIPLNTSLMGVNIVKSSTSPYSTNSVQPSGSGLYSGPYELIQTANFVIDKTSALQVTDPRKTQIIAEAKFLRALGHFYLLRLFGQFWDLNSKYGIEIKDKAKSPVSARAGVQTSYDFILADLDEAIANCPEYKRGVAKGYATKLAAKALKARVLLYQKDYTRAAVLAREVMAGPAVLSDDFLKMFTKDKYNSDEVILASVTFANNNNKYFENGKDYYWMSDGVFLADAYKKKLAGDKRNVIIVKNAADPADSTKWRGNGKFATPLEGSRNDTEYYLRLAETYLIYAEAETRRIGGSLTDALAALNTVRLKRGMGAVSGSSPAQLLALIRAEKELELGAESGEDWFDIVRYIKNGDITASSVKLSLTDENKLILPIPQISVDGSNQIIQQNPGY